MQKRTRLGEYYFDWKRKTRMKDGKKKREQVKERKGMPRRSQGLEIVKLEIVKLEIVKLE